MKRVLTSLLTMLLLFAVGAQADYSLGDRVQGPDAVNVGDIVVFEAASSTGNFTYYIKPNSSSDSYGWYQGFDQASVWKVVAAGTKTYQSWTKTVYYFQNVQTGKYMAGTNDAPTLTDAEDNAVTIALWGKDKPWTWVSYDDQTSNPKGWDDNSVAMQLLVGSNDYWLRNDIAQRESGSFSGMGLHNFEWNAYYAVDNTPTPTPTPTNIITVGEGQGLVLGNHLTEVSQLETGNYLLVVNSANQAGNYVYQDQTDNTIKREGAKTGASSYDEKNVVRITVTADQTDASGAVTGKYVKLQGLNGQYVSVSGSGNTAVDSKDEATTFLAVKTTSGIESIYLQDSTNTGNYFNGITEGVLKWTTGTGDWSKYAVYPVSVETVSTIAWNVVDASGTTVATDTLKNCVAGTQYTTSLASVLGVTLDTPTVEATAADQTITTGYTFDESAYPFCLSTANDTTWYQLTIQRSPVKYCQYNAETKHVANTATAPTTVTDIDRFAFVGTPFGFQLINRAAGAAAPFGPATATNNMKLVAGDKADAATLIYQNNSGHQVFRFANASEGYVNDVNDELGVWLSGNGATDGGSTLTFTEVNPNDVPAVITWNIVDGEGNTVLTETINGYVGKTYDATAANTDGTAFSAIPGLTLDPATITPDAATYTATSTYTIDESAYPIKFSTNANDATWYSLKIRGSQNLSVNADGTINSKSAAPAEETDGAYLFAFVGNPLGFNLVNYNLGFDAPFGPASAASSPKLVSGDKASAATLIYGHSTESGYESYNLIRYANDKQGYLNDVNGTLAVWSSVNNRHDAGSNFVFTEVELPEDDVLAEDSIADGYYRIVSADAAFGTASYALSVVDNALVWAAEDATDAKQIFQLTNTNDPYTDGGGVHAKFNTYNPASGLYIGNSPSWGNTAPTLSSTVWQTCFTLIADSTIHSQWAVQPWHGNMLSQCIAPDDDTTTGGSLVQKTWYENVTIGSNCAWVLKKVSDEKALNLLEGDIANSLDDLIAKYDTVQLDTTAAPGYYVAANVQALAEALTSAKAAQQGTVHEKYVAANALNEAYNKAISEYQPITEGYYYLVSDYAAYETNFGAPAAIYTAPKATLTSTGAHPAMYEKFDAQNANFIYHLTAKDAAAGKWNVQNAYTGWYLNTGNGSSWYGEVTIISDTIANAQIFRNYQLGNFWVADETDTNVSRAVRRNNTQNGTVYGWTQFSDNIADADKWYNAWKLVPVSQEAAEQIIAAQATKDSITAKALADLRAYVSANRDAINAAAQDSTLDDSTIIQNVQKAVQAYNTTVRRASYDIVSDSATYAGLQAGIESALEEYNAATGEHIDYWQIAAEASAPAEGKTFAVKNAYNSKYLSTHGGTATEVNTIANTEIWTIEASGKTVDNQPTYYLKSATQPDSAAYWQYEDYASKTWDATTPYDGYDWFGYAGLNAEFGPAATAQEFTILAATANADPDTRTGVASGKEPTGYVLTAAAKIMDKFYKLGVQGSNAAMEPYNEDVAWLFYETTGVEDPDSALQIALNKYGNKVMTGGTDPGYYSAAAVAEYNQIVADAKAAQEGTSSAKRASVQAMLATDTMTFEVNPIVEGYYYIVSAGNGPGLSGGPYNNEEKFAMYNDGDRLKWAAYDQNDTKYIYQFTPSGSNWMVKNVVANTYIGQGTAAYGQQVTTTADSTVAQVFTTTSEGKFAINPATGLYVYSTAANHNGSTEASGLMSIWGTPSEAATYGVNVWYLKTVPADIVDSLLEAHSYYDDLLALTDSISKNYTIGTGLGQYTATDSLTAALDAAKALTGAAKDDSKNAEYQAALAALQGALNGGLTLNLPTTGTFITLKNRVSGGYLTSEATSADAQATTASAETAEAAQIWYYTTGTDGKGQLVSYYSGEFLNVNWQTQVSQPGLGASGTTIYGYAEYPGTYCIYVPSGGWAHGYANEDGTIGATKGASMTGEQYAWEIEAVSELPVSLQKYGTEGYTYATTYVPATAVVPEGVKAYAVTAEENSKLSISELGDTIPASTPVLLISKESDATASLTLTGEGGTASQTLLQGIATAAQQNSNGLYLGEKDDKVGFYTTDNTGYVAYGAYLPVSAVSADAASVGGLALNIDKITGINSASADNASGIDPTKPIYNVQGQRVSATYKGIVIQNGKKYILK